MEVRERPMKAVMDLDYRCRRAIEREMNDLGLSSIQSRLLGHLYFQYVNGRRVLQSELEAEFCIRKSSVTSVIQILEKKGLIERLRVEGDARRKELVLTQKGIELQETVISRLNDLERRMSEALEPQELEQFLDCIRRMETRLKEAEYD